MPLPSAKQVYSAAWKMLVDCYDFDFVHRINSRETYGELPHARAVLVGLVRELSRDGTLTRIAALRGKKNHTGSLVKYRDWLAMPECEREKWIAACQKYLPPERRMPHPQVTGALAGKFLAEVGGG